MNLNESGRNLHGVVELVALAKSKRIWIAVAESLTGGLLSAEIVAIPGASAVFTGGVIVYDTALKHSLLGVDAALLALRGPVDSDVAAQMAEGVRRACGVPDPATGVIREADLGVATTGVAGPDPDPQTGLPAGTVWVAVSSSKGTQTVMVPGLAGLGRQSIRTRAVDAAVDLAVRVLGDS